MLNKYGRRVGSVQNFALGGIANPSQTAFLRGSDKSYLDARQAELDAFEEQRQSYNTALQDWQTNVYNPYKEQVGTYNTAAEKYNTDVYNPYKTQYDEYAAAVEAYNAGDRTAGYAGPAEPKIASTFGMTAPTAPKDFSMAAPSLPFKEEDITTYQQEAGDRARRDAGNRAVAIDVVSNPDQFNFGSMSVSNRFMAEGGEVMSGREPAYTAEQIKSAIDISRQQGFSEADVATGLGRYLTNPAAVQAALAANPKRDEGGAVNSGDFAGIEVTVYGPDGAVYGSPREARAAGVYNSTMQPPAPAAAAPTTAAQDLTKLTGATTTAAAPVTAAPTSTASQQLTNLNNATTAAAPTNNNAAVAAQPSNTLTAAIARDLMHRSMTTGVPTSEFDRYGGYAAVQNMYQQGGGTYARNEISDADKKTYAAQIATTGVGNLALLGETGTQLTQEGINNMRGNGIDESTIANAIKAYGGKAITPLTTKPPLTTKTPAKVLPPVTPSANWSVTPATYKGATSTGVSGYSGPIPSAFKNIFAATPGGWNGTSLTPKKPKGSSPPGGGGLSTPETTPITASSVPTFDYTSRGVGSAINNVPVPTFGIGQAREYVNATNPTNFFNIAQPGAPGISSGTTALGPADLPVASARATLGTIGKNRNLTPTMLGGMENAGYRVDRLGNSIYAPMAGLSYFAKGGDVSMADIRAMNIETLSDEEPEEVILTNPVGTAQKFLADLNSAGKASPTRQSIKRTKTSAGGGATADKAMQMGYEGIAKGDLGAMKDRAPTVRNTESARAQMEELARVYQLKARGAQEKGRGFLADTFGAPTLEQPTLTKGKLTKKRFKDGGEAKKAVAENVKEPGIFGVSDYATKASARMFPGQAGQDDQRDAARHMLAAAALAKKFGMGTAEFLGKAHERLSNPKSFFNMLGIGEPRYDYEVDVHNNKLGAELASRTTSQAELEKLVRAMALQSQDKQVLGKPWTMTKEQLQAVDDKNEKAATPPEYRADGSPEEGELSQEEIDAASKPAFVTPKSGKGRKEGPISKQLRSGDAYVNMAKGLTEMPYNLAGAPMDMVMLARQGLTGQAPAGQVGTSDYIKSKMTAAGVRPEPPADPTAKGFYTAGDLLSNLVNPAGVTRAGVKGAEKVGQAATDVAKDFQQYNRQLAVPGASYAVRPTGSTMLTGPVGLDKNVGEVEKIVQSGISNSGNASQANLLKDFWEKKARNYFTRQFGTPDDPIAKGISNKTIKGSVLEEMFPEYMIDATAVGKTRLKEGARPADFVGPGKPEERFFPMYPRAMEDFTKRYDEATDLKGNLITTDPAAADREYNSLSTVGRNMGRRASELEADKMIVQGVNPLLINNQVGVATRSIKEPDRIVTDGTSSAKDLYAAFEESSAYNKLSPGQKTDFANDLFGKGRPVAGMDETDIGKNLLSENVRTAIEKGEPIYDVGYMRKPLSELFNPVPINTYLDSLPPRELANIRFEDAVRGGLKIRERTSQLENLVARIKSGKPVPDKVFSDGVSKPLLQFDKDSGFDGFAWKQIEKREATVPEGAYVGHSVGGYELGGPGYTSVKRDGFNTGLYRVYTLRDNRNRPVNTIEVKMEDANTPVVTQIKGNGRATGNVPAEKYDGAILRFLQTYIKPSAISESDSYLTPLLQNYQAELQMERRAQIAIQRRRAGMEEIERLRNQLR